MAAESPKRLADTGSLSNKVFISLDFILSSLHIFIHKTGEQVGQEFVSTYWLIEIYQRFLKSFYVIGRLINVSYWGYLKLMEPHFPYL